MNDKLQQQDAAQEKPVMAMMRFPSLQNIEEAKKAFPQFLQLQQDMADLVMKIKNLTITNVQTQKIKDGFLSDLSKLLKEYKETRLLKTKDVRDAVKKFNDWLIPTEDSLTQILEDGKKEVITFDKKQKAIEEAKKQQLLKEQQEEECVRQEKAQALQRMQSQFMELCKTVIRRINQANAKEDFGRITSELMYGKWPDFGELKETTQGTHDKLINLGRLRWNIIQLDSQSPQNITRLQNTKIEFDQLMQEILGGEELTELVEEKQSQIVNVTTDTDKALKALDVVVVPKLSITEVRLVKFRQQEGKKIEEVSPAFLMLNPDTIKTYQTENLEIIKAALKNSGAVAVGGVEFYYETSERFK